MSNREFYFPRKTLQVSSWRFRAWRLVFLLAETTDLMFVCLSVLRRNKESSGGEVLLEMCFWKMHEPCNKTEFALTVNLVGC